MNNRSSVTYNILNNDSNSASGAIIVKMLDKKVTNKKKGVAEITDLTRPFHPNFNRNYKDYLNENPKIFNAYNGIFSHMYDAAHRNGNIVVPFRNSTNNPLNPIVHQRIRSGKNNSKSPKKDKN